MSLLGVDLCIQFFFGGGGGAGVLGYNSNCQPVSRKICSFDFSLKKERIPNL